MQNVFLNFEDELHLQKNENEGENIFILLVLILRQTANRKWPVNYH